MLNKDHADFHKIIVTVNRFNGNYLPLVYVQYYFEGDEHEITSNQLFRGNNLQKGKPRQATNFSERQKIRELSKAGMKGKKVFRKICADAGGFEKARTANDMSNLLGQIYDISRKSISKQGELVELLDLCQKQKNTPDTFVRSIQTGDNFCIFLSTDQQLHNLKRFCIGKCCSIIGVDTTFNIYDYNVTISTYRHPLLIDKRTESFFSKC